jgi:exonuclease III
VPRAFTTPRAQGYAGTAAFVRGSHSHLRSSPHAPDAQPATQSSKRKKGQTSLTSFLTPKGGAEEAPKPQLKASSSGRPAPTLLAVSYGIGKKELDEEGRSITLEFENFFAVGLYVPNAGAP